MAQDYGMDLIYSADDGGWYFQRYSDWKVSQLFDTEDDAIAARNRGELEWE